MRLVPHDLSSTGSRASFVKFAEKNFDTRRSSGSIQGERLRPFHFNENSETVRLISSRLVSIEIPTQNDSPEESGPVVKKVPRKVTDLSDGFRRVVLRVGTWSTAPGEVDKRETSDTSPRPIFLPGRSTQPRLDDLEGPPERRIYSRFPNVRNVSRGTTARGSGNLQYKLDEYEFCSYEYMGKYEARDKKLFVKILKIFGNLKNCPERIFIIKICRFILSCFNFYLKNNIYGNIEINV